MTANAPDAPPPARSAGRLADVLWLAVGGAVLVALVSVASVEFRLRVLHTLTWTSRDFAVLTWAGNLSYFLVAVPPVFLVTRLVRRRFGLSPAAITFALLSFLAIVLMLPRIHPLAQLALSMGLAWQVGGAIGRDPGRWMPRVRALAGGGTFVLALLGLAAYGERQLDERRARRALASTSAAADAPNIILLILDTVRAANLSAYGYDRATTPVLSRLAREGTLFEHAISAASWTAPSHASMMTGLRAGESEADYLSPMVDSARTVAEVLAQRGYATGGFVANAGFAGHQMGIARGFSRFEDYPFSWQQALWSSTLAQTRSGLEVLESIDKGQWSRLRRALVRPDLRTVTVRRGREHTAAEITRNFLAWRDGAAQGRRFFALLNVIDAHAPYSPPDGFAERFNGGKRLVDSYDGSIAYVDSIVGVLVEQLRARGDLDRTVLIVTADHGELFGEHGIRGHGSSLFRPVLHVPLIVRAPGNAPAGARVSSVVSLRDIAATLVDLAGAPTGTLPGSSLVPVWKGSGTPADGALALSESSPAVNPAPRNLTKFGPIKGALDSTWHYIRYGNGREQLFAWRTDPEELVDVAPRAARAPEVARFREIVARELDVTRGASVARVASPDR